jgi:hypothetical protein
VAAGEERAAQLDALFTEPAPSKYAFPGQFPDLTGLIGMYAHPTAQVSDILSTASRFRVAAIPA